MTTETSDTATTPEQYTRRRVRVTQEGGELLFRLLMAEKMRLMIAHRQAPSNRRAKIVDDDMYHVQMVLDEVKHTLEEAGWNL